MPIYEYQCRKCKKVHEIWQKISEAPKTSCPDCKGRMDRLISAAGFQLKGSGWYITDYQRKGSGKENKEKKGEGASKGDSQGESKGGSKGDSRESKPSGKKESKKKSDEPARAA